MPPCTHVARDPLNTEPCAFAMSSASSHRTSEFGPLQLLILQASPFCNIDCKYCYLPDRSLKHRMPVQVAEAAVRFVLDAELIRERFTVVWHAGEPLAVPISFYREVVSAINRIVGSRYQAIQNVQTNGILINQEWCDLFKENKFQVGVSIDGPQFLHDANRVTRSAKGTFARTMRGVQLLRDNGIDFHVIAVLTKATLAHADEFFDFFRRLGVSRVGFNIEEVEGVHRHSSIGRDTEAEYVLFLQRIAELSRTCEPKGALPIRELTNMEGNIRAYASGAGRTRGQECTPFLITSVDSKGNLSTFSPELLGNTGDAYSGFVFGNVLCDTFEDVVNRPTFQTALREINAGIAMCARTCQYFPVCGGGAPSNKYFENGTFVSAETLHCRYKIQIVAEQVLRDLEASLVSEVGVTA
jgi:uncharacterized protein